MDFIRTLRFAWRLLAKSPGASLLAVLALGLGIGLTAVMFSLIRGFVLRGLPFEEAERLVHVESSSPGNEQQQSLEVTQHDYVDFAAQQSSFEGLAAFDVVSVNLSDDAGYPERYRAGAMTANAFSLLRVEPFLGRGFTDEDAEPGAAAVTILGYDLWRTRFAEDRAVLGRTVRLNSEPATVVGVMPPSFRFPVNEDLWTPFPIDLARIRRGEGQALEVYGRLRDGVSLAAARADLGTIAARLAETYPETNEGRGVVLKPYQEEFVRWQTAALLKAMMVAASLVLWIACANVASLLLARASKRSQELAIRTALGARRWRVVGQLLTDAFVLASLGSVLGLGVAYAGTALLARSIDWMPLPFWVRLAVDPQVVVFVVGTTLAAGLLAGLLPALQASRADVNDVLKAEARGGSGLRLGRISRALVVAEIALACALLVATALMVRTIQNLDSGNMGFATEGIFTARVRLSNDDYPEVSDRARFFDRLADEVEALPEVESVALMSSPPGTGMGDTFYAVEGESYATASDYPRTFRGTVTPGFFATFEIPVLRGRVFDARDTEEAPPVVVVNQSFADAVWPRQDPLGKRLRLGRDETEEPWRTVVGVVPDAGLEVLLFTPPAGLYVPYSQQGDHTMSLAISTRAHPAALTAIVRERVGAQNRNLAIYSLRSMERVLWETTFTARFLGSLFSVFGVVALVLASLGIYGVMTFSVQARTHEIGVRMAFGARRGDVLGLVLRQGMGRVAVGLVLGVGLAYALASSIRIVLFEVEPGDPLSFAATSLVLVAVALVACLIPAYRASRVDPLAALRHE